MKATRMHDFQKGALIVALTLGFWASSVSAVIFTNANVAADLTNATRWVGEGGPNWADPANNNILLWDSTLATAANCTNGVGGIAWPKVNGLRILNPAAAVHITNNVAAGSALQICGAGGAGAGIDMSQASVDLTIDGTTANKAIYFSNPNSYTVNVASAHALNLFGAGVIMENSTLSLSGAGKVAFSGSWEVGKNYANGLATLNINSGILTNAANNNFIVGSGTTGVVNQTGGTVALSALYIGNANAGTYNLSGGMLSGNLSIGQNNCDGTLNVSGGTISQSAGASFIIGSTGTGKGHYIQSGGVVTASWFRLASTVSLGDFVISNGTFYAANWDTFASGTSTTGRFVMVGGTTMLPAFPTTRGAGAYTDITMDGGTLQPRADSTTYMQGLNYAYLTTNGAVFNTVGNSITVAQLLENASSQAGKLTKTGLGVLTLAGANTYSGGTTINGGALQFNSGALPASGLVTINAGGALNATGAYANVTAWLGSGRIATNSAGAIALIGNSTENIDFGVYSNLMMGASGAATYSGTLTPYNNIYRFGGGGATLTISGALGDSGGARSVVIGSTGSAGTVVFPSANTYSGGTTIAGGTLNIGHANALGTALLTMQDGATLYPTTFLNGGTGVPNAINLAGAATINANYHLLLSGVITNSGSLTKDGTYGLYITGTNTYSGGTTLNNGLIYIYNASALGSGAVTINSGTYLDLWQIGTTNHNNIIINSSGSAGTSAALMTHGGGTTTAWFDGTITLGLANSTVGTYDSNHMSILGKITGTGGLTKGVGYANEAGTLTFYNTGNDYNGNTVITVGWLKLGASEVIPHGSGKGNLVLNGGATFAGKLDLNGVNEAINGLSGTNNTYLGMVTNTVASTTNTFTVGANDATSAFAGLIAGKILLTKIGNGTLTLSGTNTYNAGTVISNGLIAIGNNQALGSGPVTLAGGSLMGATGTWTVSNAVNVVSNATLDTAGNNLTLAGAVTNSGSLTKIGAGTLTLAGTNGYAGVLTVSNGVVALATTNALAGNNSLVMAGGSCDLNGQTQVVSTVTGTAPFSNGTLRVTGSLTPGGSDTVGTLPVAGNLIVGENAVINWNYGSSTQDLIQVTGALALPNVATVNVSRVTGSTADFPKPGIVFSFGSCSRSGTLSQWVINGVSRPDIRAVVRDGQVVLVPASGMILEIQ